MRGRVRRVRQSGGQGAGRQGGGTSPPQGIAHCGAAALRAPYHAHTRLSTLPNVLTVHRIEVVYGKLRQLGLRLPPPAPFGRGPGHGLVRILSTRASAHRPQPAGQPVARRCRGPDPLPALLHCCFQAMWRMQQAAQGFCTLVQQRRSQPTTIYRGSEC